MNRILILKIEFMKGITVFCESSFGSDDICC